MDAYSMKRYILNAEFLKWKVDEPESQKDSMNYVVELVSDEEAKTRLESLIIERMSSKPGWTFELVDSSYAEFTDESSSTTLPENENEKPVAEASFIPELIAPFQSVQEIELGPSDSPQANSPDPDNSDDPIDQEQFQT